VNLPWSSRSRVAWWAIGLVLAAALAFVFWRFVGTFVFGLFIYYATRPVYRRLRRWVRPPSLAALVALLALALPAILLLAYTIAVALQEVGGLIDRVGTDGPVADLLRPYINVSQVVEDPETLLSNPDLRVVIEDFWTEAVNYLGFIGNGALHLFVMVAIAFYLLRDDHRLAAWFRRRFADGDGVLLAYATAVDRDFSNIFFGNILNAILTGVIGALTYNALDYLAPPGLALPYATLLGLLAGVASLIPVVGMKLVYFPVLGYLLYDAYSVNPELLWFPVAFGVVSFVIVDAIPDLVLRPYVSGRGLHLGMVMFAYIFGPLLFGWPGLFLGPMLLVLSVHFARIVLPELVAGEPIRPAAVGDSVTTGGDDGAAAEGGGEDPADS